MNNAIHLLLADDNSIYRQSFKRALETISTTIKVEEECIDGIEIVPILEKNNAINTVILDYNMPGINGIESTRLIKSKFPHIKVIGLSFDNSDWLKKEMLAAGASTVLSKDADIYDILKAFES